VETFIPGAKIMTELDLEHAHIVNDFINAVGFFGGLLAAGLAIYTLLGWIGAPTDGPHIRLARSLVFALIAIGFMGLFAFPDAGFSINLPLAVLVIGVVGQMSITAWSAWWNHRRSAAPRAPFMWGHWR
jgi:ATP-dependent protease ClpP protease subunit